MVSPEDDQSRGVAMAKQQPFWIKQVTATVGLSLQKLLLWQKLSIRRRSGSGYGMILKRLVFVPKLSVR
jgi:hypothetical protein